MATSSSSLQDEVKGAGKGEGRSGKREIQDHQKRECKSCGAVDHWRRMEYTSVTNYADSGARERAGTSAEKEDIREGKQYGTFEYTCVKCVAKREGCDIADARRKVKQPRTAKGIARCHAFAEAVANIQEKFQFLAVLDEDDDEDAAGSPVSGSTAALDSGVIKYKSEADKKKQLRRLATIKVAGMKQIFKPLAQILALKHKDMTEAVEATRRLQSWLNRKNGGEDGEDAEEGDKLEIEFETAAYKQRAFEGHEDAVGMRNAADYTDQWFKHAETAFNVYYVCMAGGEGNTCNTLIQSLDWERLHDAPHATKQRWYCMCGAKYKTKFGVLVEIVTSASQALYCKADLPPHDLQDAKFMKVQQDFAQCKTPEELINALPRAAPMEKAKFITKVPGRDGHFKFDYEMFAGLEKLEWMQLYNFMDK